MVHQILRLFNMRVKIYPNKSNSSSKKIYVREELLALTKSLPKTILLEQFLKKDNYNQNDWFNFTVRNLIEESLLGVAQPTMNNYLSYLINNGWIDKRKNPTNKWDKKNQYKCNLSKIETDLKNLGFCLPCYKETSQTFQSEVIRHV